MTCRFEVSSNFSFFFFFFLKPLILCAFVSDCYFKNILHSERTVYWNSYNYISFAVRAIQGKTRNCLIETKIRRLLSTARRWRQKVRIKDASMRYVVRTESIRCSRIRKWRTYLTIERYICEFDITYESQSKRRTAVWLATRLTIRISRTYRCDTCVPSVRYCYIISASRHSFLFRYFDFNAT